MSPILSLLMLASAAVQQPVPDAFTTSDIEAPGPQGPLKGTLTRANRAGGPVILMIPGSGPTDRDGNNPHGIRAATYKLLAEALGQRGISTVRIDKRGMFASAGTVPDANAVTIPDYVTDTRAWVASTRKATKAPCVWILGHSEGGLVALATAAERADGICGLLLVAMPGRPMGEVIKDQLRANPANASFADAGVAAIDRLQAGQRVETADLPGPLASMFPPVVQGYMISAFALDPAKLVARYSGPVLILQGDRDIQVGTADAKRLAQARPGPKLGILADTNHVLKRVTSADMAANLATYADPNLPLAPGAVDAIAEFVEQATRP